MSRSCTVTPTSRAGHPSSSAHVCRFRRCRLPRIRAAAVRVSRGLSDRLKRPSRRRARAGKGGPAGQCVPCLTSPRWPKRDLIGPDARTAPEMGRASKRNGELLRLAEREFDVFLTVDRKLQHQQNLPTFNIGIVVMLAHTNALLDLRPLIPEVPQALTRIKPGQAIVVGT